MFNLSHKISKVESLGYVIHKHLIKCGDFHLNNDILNPKGAD